MNVAITIDNSYSLFANGLNQNILFLYWLIRDLGYNPFLVDVGNPDEDPEFGVRYLDKGARIIGLQEFLAETTSTDILLMPGAALLDEHISLLKKRNKKMKSVVIHYGNLFFDDLQKIVFTLGAGQQDDNSVTYYESNMDEIWLSPHYQFSSSYYELMHRTRVKEVPYIWNPAVIDKVREKRDMAYRPNSSLKVIGVTEPNINFSKNCYTAICVLEKHYRSYENKFDKALIYGAEWLANRDLFSQHIVRNFDLPHEKDKIFFLKRFPPDEMFIDDEVNLILSHQHYNGLNYGHMEALYLNYPLVHNSPEISDAGYYYDLFDINAGAKALDEALSSHDSSLNEHADKAGYALGRYSPKNPEVQGQYVSLLEGLR